MSELFEAVDALVASRAPLPPPGSASGCGRPTA